MADHITIWCWYCKKEIPEDADVCPHCAMPLTPAKKVLQCHHCGRFLLLSSDVCDMCGTEVDKPALTPPEEPESAEEVFPSAERKAAKKNAEPRSPIKVIVPVLLAVVFLALALKVGSSVIKRDPASPSAQPGDAGYCAEGAHKWQAADCTTPKTCTVCGKTEGEALGHDFVDNVCTRCGEIGSTFYFYDNSSVRHGSNVTFAGKVQNFSGETVTALPVKVMLYDKDKKLVDSVTTVASPDDPLAPMASAPWELVYTNWEVRWKYWRVTAIWEASDKTDDAQAEPDASQLAESP
ncbi:MAG: hypothetical protein E7474_00615 [Ruminococcaceae bacterium]|nr:hypothetical protein [Oscillospiraceae bacterium]